LLRRLKNHIKSTRFYDLIKLFRDKREIDNWEKKGRPIPPPSGVKQKIVQEYGEKNSLNILVETGTYSGDMIWACRRSFNQIYSIEFDEKLFLQATRKFAKFHHISIRHGDSAEVLPEILRDITQPCLFWLDAHYSGGITGKAALETPIIKEIQAIMAHPLKGHMILIDDARMFTGENDYPTMKDLEKIIATKFPDKTVEVYNDIIRIGVKQI
jgi:hypothetical protein